jgi:hypothetical protein
MKLYRIGNHLKPHRYQTKNFFKEMSNNNRASDKLNQGKPATVDDYQDHTPFKGNSPNARIDPTRYNEDLKRDPILDAYKTKEEKIRKDLNYKHPDFVHENLQDAITDDTTENSQDLEAEDKEYPNMRNQDNINENKNRKI